MAYAPQTGRSLEEKDSFWDQMISVTGNIPASELIVVGGDLNGHVGTNVDGYDGVHRGYGFGERNADGERIPGVPYWGPGLVSSLEALGRLMGPFRHILG